MFLCMFCGIAGKLWCWSRGNLSISSDRLGIDTSSSEYVFALGMHVAPHYFCTAGVILDCGCIIHG